MSPGIEETVALALYSPHARARSWSPPSATTRASCTGISTSRRPTAIPSRRFSGNTKDVSGGELNPNVIVRVGRARNGGTRTSATRSTAARPGTSRRRCPIPRRTRATSPSPPTATIWVWTPRDAGPVRHVGQGRDLDGLRGPAQGDARGRRSREPQALLRDGALRREAVREHRRRGATSPRGRWSCRTVCPSAAAAARTTAPIAATTGVARIVSTRRRGERAISGWRPTTASTTPRRSRRSPFPASSRSTPSASARRRRAPRCRRSTSSAPWKGQRSSGRGAREVLLCT